MHLSTLKIDQKITYHNRLYGIVVSGFGGNSESVKLNKMHPKLRDKYEILWRKEHNFLLIKSNAKPFWNFPHTTIEFPSLVDGNFSLNVRYVTQSKNREQIKGENGTILKMQNQAKGLSLDINNIRLKNMQINKNLSLPYYEINGIFSIDNQVEAKESLRKGFGRAKKYGLGFFVYE